MRTTAGPSYRHGGASSSETRNPPRWCRPNGRGTYLSLVEEVDVNCANPSERLRAASGFRRRNMTDPIQPPLVFDPGQSSWQPVIPGTRLAVFATQICAVFAVHHMQPL